MEISQKKELVFQELTFNLIGAAKEVYRFLGNILPESVYEDALCYELDLLGISFQQQVEVDVYYKDTVFKNKFRADLLVDNKVLIEVKAIKAVSDRDEAQLLNYLKLTKLKVGLLFNFGLEKFEFKRKIL